MIFVLDTRKIFLNTIPLAFDEEYIYHQMILNTHISSKKMIRSDLALNKFTSEQQMTQRKEWGEKEV